MFWVDVDNPMDVVLEVHETHALHLKRQLNSKNHSGACDESQQLAVLRHGRKDIPDGASDIRVQTTRTEYMNMFRNPHVLCQTQWCCFSSLMPLHRYVCLNLINLPSECDGKQTSWCQSFLCTYNGCILQIY
ncbi:hypothetical protein EG68_10303 [Paragonimus skrjabini miyazakii]|uniref:Uncharacterized protein n=1 Tax=Paragonimus skrjabini miyazakii TaxID=59628 RepID=A0A8S9YDZ8_9TREM|nr:hypothetical protein EG68_10303 [Paragonimus skrjabini miyazakii]